MVECRLTTRQEASVRKTGSKYGDGDESRQKQQIRMCKTRLDITVIEMHC